MLTAKNNRFDRILILSLSVASIVKIHTKEFVASLQIQKDATYNSDCKKINLIPNKAFRYYNL